MVERNKQTQFTNTEHREIKQSNTNPNLNIRDGCIEYSLLWKESLSEQISSFLFVFECWLEYTHMYRYLSLEIDSNGRLITKFYDKRYVAIFQ